MRATKSVLLASTILSAVSAYNLSASAAPLQGEVLAQAAPAARGTEEKGSARTSSASGSAKTRASAAASDRRPHIRRRRLHVRRLRIRPLRIRRLRRLAHPVPAACRIRCRRSEMPPAQGTDNTRHCSRKFSPRM